MNTDKLIKNFSSIGSKDRLIGLSFENDTTIITDYLGDTLILQGDYRDSASTILDSHEVFMGQKLCPIFDPLKAMPLPDICLDNLLVVFKFGEFFDSHFIGTTRIDNNFCVSTTGKRLVKLPFPFEVEYTVSNDLLKRLKRIRTKASKLYWDGDNKRMYMVTEEKGYTVIAHIPEYPIKWPDTDYLIKSFCDNTVSSLPISNISGLQLSMPFRGSYGMEIMSLVVNGITGYYLKDDIDILLSVSPQLRPNKVLLSPIYNTHTLIIQGDNGAVSLISPINPDYL
jgi:hypothetical protein